MMYPLTGLVATVLLQVAPPPFVANDGVAAAGLLHVGLTNIRCATLPCPTRALFEPDANGHAQRDKLLYSDLHGNAPPPPMVGDDAARDAVVRAWEQRQCLAIEGRLIGGEDDRPVLRVDRVIGRCDGE